MLSAASRANALAARLASAAVMLVLAAAAPATDAAAPAAASMPTEQQIKMLEVQCRQAPNFCQPHFELGKALCKKAGGMKKGCPEQATLYRRAVSELRVAIRKGKGNATSQSANQYLMTLPKDVVAPRTDADTPMIAAAHGINGLMRGGEASKPKVLEFYASWCQPCKMLKPLIEKAKTTYGDKVEFVSYNVDDPKTEKLIEDYEVSPIPTLIFLGPDNQVVSYAIGFSGETGINNGLKKILTASEPTPSAPSTPSASVPTPPSI